MWALFICSRGALNLLVCCSIGVIHIYFQCGWSNYAGGLWGHPNRLVQVIYLLLLLKLEGTSICRQREFDWIILIMTKKWQGQGAREQCPQPIGGNYICNPDIGRFNRDSWQKHRNPCGLTIEIREGTSYCLLGHNTISLFVLAFSRLERKDKFLGLKSRY